jgi:hypothetical protein
MKYTSSEIIRHLERNWESNGFILTEGYGPEGKLDPDFKVVEFPPGGKHHFWIYSTAGMSIGEQIERNIELHIFSSKQDRCLIRVLASSASYHRNYDSLGLNHTVNLGEPWQDKSICDHGFISLPYLDGPDLEIYENSGGQLHNLWLIPITESERDYTIEHGWEKLEELFEEKGLDYLNPARDPRVNE